MRLLSLLVVFVAMIGLSFAWTNTSPVPDCANNYGILSYNFSMNLLSSSCEGNISSLYGINMSGYSHNSVHDCSLTVKDQRLKNPTFINSTHMTFSSQMSRSGYNNPCSFDAGLTVNIPKPFNWTILTVTGTNPASYVAGIVSNVVGQTFNVSKINETHTFIINQNTSANTTITTNYIPLYVRGQASTGNTFLSGLMLKIDDYPLGIDYSKTILNSSIFMYSEAKGYSLRSQIGNTGTPDTININKNTTLFSSDGYFIIPKITFIPSTDSLPFYYNSQFNSILKNNSFSIVLSDNDIWYACPATSWTTASEVKTITCYQVSNSAPSKPTACSITSPSSTAYKNDSYQATATGSTDAQDDSITYYYQFENGAGTILQSYSTSNNYTLCQYNSNCNRDSGIQVKCKAYDGQLYSQETNPSFKLISNAPPSAPIIQAVSPSTAYKSDILTTTITGSSDADGDSLTYYSKWINTTSNMTNFSTSLSSLNCLTTTGCYRNGTISLVVYAYDGYANSSESNVSRNISNTIPEAPTLTSPSNNSNVGGRPVTFTWSNITDVDNDVIKYQFCYGETTPSTCINNISTNQYNLSNLTANTTYYWNTLAYDESNSTNSSTFQFYYAGSPNITGISPNNNTVITINETILEINATLQSNSSNLYYAFYVNDTELINSTNSTYNLSTTENYYTWYVLISDDYGTTNSTTHNFTTNLDFPQLNITSPANGTTVSGLATTLTLNLTDSSPTTCYYEIYRNVTAVLESNTSFNCSSSEISFEVSTYSAYSIYVNVIDRLNQQNTSSIYLTFSVPTVTPPAGGSSSGGGTTIIIPQNITAQNLAIVGSFPVLKEIAPIIAKYWDEANIIAKEKPLGIPNYLIFGVLISLIWIYRYYNERKTGNYTEITLFLLLLAMFILLGFGISEWIK